MSNLEILRAGTNKPVHPKPDMKVVIQFIDQFFQEFNVMEPQFPKIIKYTGRIETKLPHKKDYCTCMIFTIKNTAEFVENNKHAFQCKHIKTARSIRYEGHPQ